MKASDLSRIIRMSGRRVAAKVVADIIDDMAVQYDLLERERDRLKVVCLEVDGALANQGLAEIAILTRHRLRHAAGFADAPDPKKLREIADLYGVEVTL